MRPLELGVDEMLLQAVCCVLKCVQLLPTNLKLFEAVEVHGEYGSIASLPGNSGFPPEPKGSLITHAH